MFLFDCSSQAAQVGHTRRLATFSCRRALRRVLIRCVIDGYRKLGSIEPAGRIEAPYFIENIRIRLNGLCYASYCIALDCLPTPLPDQSKLETVEPPFFTDEVFRGPETRFFLRNPGPERALKAKI